MLARRGQAIMTTFTGSQHLKVIHGHGWIPHTGAVAIFADIGRADVLQPFAGSDDAIVATDTAFGGRGVVKACR